MKKSILLVLFFFTSIFTFAEDFKGFLNIPFGTPTQSFKYQMQIKGYSPLIEGDSVLLYSSVNTYGGKKITSLLCDCSTGYLKQIDITFENNQDAKLVFDALIKKYGLIKSKDTYITKDSSVVFELEDNCLCMLTTKKFSSVDFDDL